MVYGYASVSSGTQKLTRQLDSIRAACPEVLYIYTDNGAERGSRHKWKKLYNIVTHGDTVIFESVLRMACNAHEGISDYLALYDRGVRLVFLKESYINTDVYRRAFEQTLSVADNAVSESVELTNQIIKYLAAAQIQHIFDAAQKQADDLHRRVSEGIRATQARNQLLPEEERKQIGRKKGATNVVKKKEPAKQMIVKYSKWFSGTLSDKDTMQLVGLSRNTYYKYKREIYEDMLSRMENAEK